ncbi:hypothetical protein CIW83_18315 [Tissierella sp. P1]|uniref:hypothetical protein n=1 Tax=Tissierella sp. P1 TaxID=1280483 RepID=UPI000BA183AF|nr:hypothetical protein [Tissierella sp. P1]OZV10774.1 hypothetical protein CIW83_18315 [Tissierella sp. P1]
MNENKGFTIKCNKCGREDEYKDKSFYSKQFDEEDGQIILGVSWGYEEGSIKCECGNIIEF